MSHHIAINSNNATVEATYYLGYPALRVAVEGTEVFFLGDLHKFADDIAKLYGRMVIERLRPPQPATLEREDPMRGEPPWVPRVKPLKPSKKRNKTKRKIVKHKIKSALLRKTLRKLSKKARR